MNEKNAKFKPTPGLIILIIIALVFFVVPGLWKAFVFMAVFTGLILYGLFFQIKVRRLLQNLPTSTVRSVALGMVELKGRLFAQQEQIAPLSGKKCAYYEIIICEDPLLNDKNSAVGRRYHLNSSKSNYIVADETGKIRLNKTGLSFDAKPSHYESLSNPDKLSLQVKNYLGKQNINLEEIYRARTIGNRNASSYQIKIIEKIIETGSQVYVVGNAQLGEGETLELGSKRMYPYLISYRNENNLLKQYTKSNIILSLVSVFNVIVTVSLVLYLI